MISVTRKPFTPSDTQDMQFLRAASVKFFILSALTLYFYPMLAMAAINVAVLGYPTAAPPADPTAQALATVVGLIVGTPGKAIATLAVAAAGLGAFFHRISWPQALVVSLGIGVVFGAASILRTATGGSAGSNIAGAVATCDSLTAGTFANNQIALNRPCEMLRLLVNSISGGIGVSIATITIILLGVGAMFGKVTYPQAMVLGLGIAFVFGAVSLVRQVWADPGDCLLNSAVSLAVGFEIQFILCRFLAEIRGDTGRFLASFAVIILGFMALMGRLSLAPVLVTVVGMVAVFGSDKIVTILVPNAWDCNSFKTPDLSLVTGAIEGVLCNIMSLVTGIPGKALASASVVMLGFGAMLGKVTYGSALITATGIAIAFGAPQIVFVLTSMVDMCALSISLGATDVNLCR